VSVKDTDKGYKQLLSKAKALKSGAMVRAGIHAQDGAAKEGELTVIEVATVHEFGTSTDGRRYAQIYTRSCGDERRVG